MEFCLYATVFTILEAILLITPILSSCTDKPPPTRAFTGTSDTTAVISAPSVLNHGLFESKREPAKSSLSDKLNHSETTQSRTTFTGVVQLPKSIDIASTQFTAALKTEAEAGHSAWRDLFDLMNHGPQMSSRSSEATGVDVIEARLHDTELFLSALNEVS